MRCGSRGALLSVGNKDWSWVGAFMGDVLSAEKALQRRGIGACGVADDFTAAQHCPTGLAAGQVMPARRE